MRLGFGRVLGDCMFCWHGGEREGGRRGWGEGGGMGEKQGKGEGGRRGKGGGEEERGGGVGMHNAVTFVGNNNGCFSYHDHHNFHMKRFSIPQSCMNYTNHIIVTPLVQSVRL